MLIRLFRSIVCAGFTPSFVPTLGLLRRTVKFRPTSVLCRLKSFNYAYMWRSLCLTTSLLVFRGPIGETWDLKSHFCAKTVNTSFFIFSPQVAAVDATFLEFL